MKRRTAWFRLIVLAGALVIGLGVLELGYRAYYGIRNAREPRQLTPHRQRGWQSTPGLNRSYDPRHYDAVHYTTDAKGFRTFGDPGTDKLRVLVLGDSFTQATQITDGATYYDYLERHHPGIEIFSYGVGGYGTLQELMALEQFKDQVRPNLILWQFCVNDFINNDHELESISRRNNNHMRRPYYEDGRVVYRHPDGISGVLAEYSYVMRRLNIIANSVLKRTAGSVEADLSLDHPAYRRSLDTTRTLMKRAIDVAGEAPIVAFNAAPFSSGEVETTAFESLCDIDRLRCVPDLRPTFREAVARGETIDGGAADAHWSTAGHAIVGEVLLNFLLDQGLIEPASGDTTSP